MTTIQPPRRIEPLLPTIPATTDWAASWDQVRQRHAALRRGAEFLMHRDDEGAPCARVAANHLRELDRLLNLLTDAAMTHVTGWSIIDAAAFARLRNTPNKLATLTGTTATSSEDHARLRATGRLASRLNHRRGLGGAPDAGEDMMMATRESPAAQCSGAPAMSTRSIAIIAGFYADIADQVLHSLAGTAARP